MITVVAALILKEGKVLLAKRSTGDKNNLGKWEFPGGKVNEFEDEKTAIVREIKEEFEIDIEAQEFIGNSIYEYKDKTIDLRLYKCIYISGKFKLNDHSMYEWVNIENILNYDLAKADVKLVEYLKFL